MLPRAIQRASPSKKSPSLYKYKVSQNARTLSSCKILQSGHSRWSTIKHDKGKNDAAKNKQRSIFASEIASTSKCTFRLAPEGVGTGLTANNQVVYGPNPNSNPRLATIISTAKRAGFPKASIEAAIARGQGVSPSGAKLESLMVEAMLPPAVAVVIDCQTDNKLRTLADVRLAIKEHEGTVTPTSYLFTKAGKIVFEAKEGINAETALETVLDLNVIDAFDDETSRIVMLTEPNETSAIIGKLESQHGLQMESSDIVWEPNQDTTASLDGEAAVQSLSDFFDEIRELAGVQAVYTNVAQGNVDDALWQDLRQKIGL